MAFNSALGSAIFYFDGETPSSAGSGYPTSAQAKRMWSGTYLTVAGRLSSCGRSIPTSGTGPARIYAADVEAYGVSYRLSRAQEIQQQGDVSPNTHWLKEQFDEMLALLCSSPGFASSLGATVTRSARPTPRSLQTKYPNPDRDTTDYANPLPEWKLTDDL